MSSFPRPTLFPYTTLFRSLRDLELHGLEVRDRVAELLAVLRVLHGRFQGGLGSTRRTDRKSTRLNSSHRCISYAVFCLKKKKDGIELRHVTDGNHTQPARR